MSYNFWTLFSNHFISISHFWNPIKIIKLKKFMLIIRSWKIYWNYVHVDKGLTMYVSLVDFRGHFPYHVCMSSCPRSLWMTPNIFWTWPENKKWFFSQKNHFLFTEKPFLMAGKIGCISNPKLLWNILLLRPNVEDFKTLVFCTSMGSPLIL